MKQCRGSGSAGSACFWTSRIRIWILPFSHKGVDWTEIMLAKQDFNTILAKNYIFKTEGNVPAGKL
jgi:hypothetical protein